MKGMVYLELPSGRVEVGVAPMDFETGSMSGYSIKVVWKATPLNANEYLECSAVRVVVLRTSTYEISVANIPRSIWDGIPQSIFGITSNFVESDHAEFLACW